MLPLGALSGRLIGSDAHSMRALVRSPVATQNRAVSVSNYGLGVLAGASVAAWGIGAWTGNGHLKETGQLSTEAMGHAALIGLVLKAVTLRERPQEGSGRGEFGGGTSWNSGFPSQHAMVSWAAASVIAREYPGWLTRWAAYGLATGVSVERIVGQKHFPSDVLIGSALGYLIGRYVYNANHDPRDDSYTLATPLIHRPRQRPSRPGPIYVPLDHWAYPVLRRLAALGFAPDASTDLAPWTRTEFRRLTEQAFEIATRPAESRVDPSQRDEALQWIGRLQREFGGWGDWIEAGGLESMYTRFTGITDSPLRDSYHFGQTIVNDFGRPYEEGINNVTGVSGYAVEGPLSLYVRGEYQYAGGRPALPFSVRQAIQFADAIPLPAANPTETTNRFVPLEMYAGVTLGPFDVTFGKQSLWWGPGESGPFHFSNNAEPFYQLRIAQAVPLVLPGPLAHLGRIRTEFTFGKLSGHQYPARPYLNAQKISLQVTDDLEIGFTRSSLFAGVGKPMTFGRVWRSLFNQGGTQGELGVNDPNDPGDRRSGFDFRWRLPGLQKYVTVYSDSLSDDDPNPLAAPRRAAWAPGIYFSQLPGLRKMDFRFETSSTWLFRGDAGPQFLYWNGQYRDAYLNNGYLLGSWVGRDGRAFWSSATYWVSPINKIEATWRQFKIAPAFWAGGGTQTDIAIQSQWELPRDLIVKASIQGERYFLPVLGDPRKNVSISVGIEWRPLHAESHR